MKRNKLVPAREVKVLDAQSGTVEAVVSTESRDRDGDVIRQSGWQLDDFNRHPVLLSSHNYGSLQSQIGTWTSMAIRGKRLVGKAQYFIGDGNAEADWAWKLIQRGVGAFSVGFIPDMALAEELDGNGMVPSYEFNGQTLLEVSQVTIPSNPDALQRMKALGVALDPAVARMVDEALREMPEPFDVESAAAIILERVKAALAEFRADIEGKVGAAEERAIEAALDRVADLLIRGAIPSHTTPKADEDAEWDAGAELREAEGRAELRRMHAWVDGGADPETKAAYKLPHHTAEGQVVWRGVAAAMSAFMGGRGGVDIPEADRRGVYAHLVRHYEQFDREPPDFESASTEAADKAAQDDEYKATLRRAFEWRD